MALKYLDAKGAYTDPTKTNLKYLRADSAWAEPDNDYKFLRADGVWAAMELYSEYALEINESVSDPEAAVSYTGGTAGHGTGWAAWKDEPIFKGIRPCVVNKGKVAYYLDPDDYTKKADGSAAVVTGADGDVMVEFPKIGYSISKAGSIITVRLTDDPAKDGFCYRAHSLDAEGDCDYIYVGAYLSSGSSQLHSHSGKEPVRYINMADARSYSQVNGDGYQQMSWYVHILYQCLYLMVSKSLDSQASAGRGWVSNNNITSTGKTDATGFCSNSGTATDGRHQVKFLGVEDPWGNACIWCDGICSNSARGVSTAFGGFSDSGASYPYNDGAVAPSDISAVYFTKAAGSNSLGFLPTASTAGSSSTYYCDTASLVYNSVPTVGGFWNYDMRPGIFHIRLEEKPTNTNQDISSRLVFKHKA